MFPYTVACNVARGALAVAASALLAIACLHGWFAEDASPVFLGALVPGVSSLSLDGEATSTGVTGKLFSGGKRLELPPAARSRLAGLNREQLQQQMELPGIRRIECRQWAVVTTIFEPAPAVVNMTQQPGWCVVVATDQGAQPYPVTGPNVVVLDPQAQEALGAYFPDFFALLPWRHFGRKNVGYLYAILNGADTVWDFKDDNVLREGAALAPPAETVRVQQSECGTFNPYPEMGAAATAWPRGYPLTLIKRPCTHSFSAPQAVAGEIAVYQSLADNEPDVDGIFRLTQPIPFNFDAAAQRTLALPAGVFCPYNAQATLVLQPALWSLLLPVSVHGRVSDIWRSYIAQRLLWDAGKVIAFTPPRVTQFRNPHNPLADMKAEEDLYYKSLALVQFLSMWRGRGHTLPERAVELMVELYERQYVGVRDVLLTAEWMRALYAAGYAFPAVAAAEVVQAVRWPAVDGGSPVPEVAAPSVEPPAAASHTPSSASTVAPSPSASTPASPSALPSASPSPPPPAPVGGRQLTFWTADLHDGCRADITSLLTRNGHIVIPGGHKMQGGPHPQVWEHPNVQWPERPLAPLITSHTWSSGYISEAEIAEMFAYYKDDPQMARVDAFVCMFPFSYCEAWMPFNKTIIFNAGHRFALGRCSTARWERLTEHVQMAARRGHVIAAMGRYDAEYIHYFTGVRPVLLPTSSLWYAGHGVTTFTQARAEILVGPMQRSGDCSGSGAVFCSIMHNMNAAAGDTFNFVAVKQLYQRFSLQDIANHRAAVLIPYAVLSYGITELYALGVPLFVPTPAFLAELGVMDDMRTTDVHYCPGVAPPSQHPNSTHPHSPEDRSSAAHLYWLQFADFYQWPHIQTFGSWPELVAKLNATDFRAVHAAMLQENARREVELLDGWARVVEGVSLTRGAMPASYEQALRDLWGAERLQVDRLRRRLGAPEAARAT
jgi:hypothetical protein